MSISIVNRPSKYSPSNNSINFQIESDNVDIVSFNVKLIEDSTDDVLSFFQCFVPPNYPNSKGTWLQLNKILDNIVNWEINVDSSAFVSEITNTWKGYRLRIRERILSGGDVVDGAEYYDLSDVGYVFEGNLDRIRFNKFNPNNYVVSSTSVAKFLTLKPNMSKVNDLSFEQLYFLSDGSASLTARVRTYSSNGTLLNTYTEAITGNSKMFRLYVSPKALNDYFSINFNNIHYYIVDVTDGSEARTEERVYYYEDTDCNVNYVNLAWVNSLGGIDSYQFVAPQDAIQTNRFQMKRNIWSLDSNDLYSDIDNNVYNPSDYIIANNAEATTRVSSKHLSNEESYWLTELYRTKQLFIELPDGSFATGILKDSSYQIPRTEYLRSQPNIVQVEFGYSSGIIPDGTHAKANIKTNAIEFISSQMESI